MIHYIYKTNYFKGKKVGQGRPTIMGIDIKNKNIYFFKVEKTHIYFKMHYILCKIM